MFYSLFYYSLFVNKKQKYLYCFQANINLCDMY
nr:MAG TPA: hypothetical protein [Caudoviricetes sp.]